jgi:hypothetical protein
MILLLSSGGSPPNNNDNSSATIQKARERREMDNELTFGAVEV